jgi:hypothetical protein
MVYSHALPTSSYNAEPQEATYNTCAILIVFRDELINKADCPLKGLQNCPHGTTTEDFVH